MLTPDLMVSLSNHEARRITPPVLVTERLILRTHTRDDLAACTTLWSDPAVTRFIGGRPSTEEEVWRRIMGYVGHWQLLGYGYFLASDIETGALVGEFGLADFHRDLNPPFGTTPEAGWAMLPQYHGKGLALEALSTILAWADHFIPRSVCMIDPANLASLNLAAKLGYSEYARAAYKDNPTVLHARVAVSRS
ncbi:Protein N-acetyltransferase, RimJ/RimL family [Devosia sp. YR412]|uniref:GNAT family N-acetyltransferase n=1 Tax=Devosia sp. YR412 TaxID=1881030 RepID=UPI0008C1654F|nr:GNAT family N-acetyltransferase [Devosia sp. YR412]SEP74633.1 Protein N-acetyltransferase, RimJ/RimL family [Devosia sp. YR412]